MHEVSASIIEPWASAARVSQVATAQFGWTCPHYLSNAKPEQISTYWRELFWTMQRTHWPFLDHAAFTRVQHDIHVERHTSVFRSSSLQTHQCTTDISDPIQSPRAIRHFSNQCLGSGVPHVSSVSISVRTVVSTIGHIGGSRLRKCWHAWFGGACRGWLQARSQWRSRESKQRPCGFNVFYRVVALQAEESPDPRNFNSWDRSQRYQSIYAICAWVCSMKHSKQLERAFTATTWRKDSVERCMTVKLVQASCWQHSRSCMLLMRHWGWQVLPFEKVLRADFEEPPSRCKPVRCEDEWYQNALSETTWSSSRSAE